MVRGPLQGGRAAEPQRLGISTRQCSGSSTFLLWALVPACPALSGGLHIPNVIGVMGKPALALGVWMAPLISATNVTSRTLPCSVPQFPYLENRLGLPSICLLFQVSVYHSEILECCAEMCVLGYLLQHCS